MSTRCMMPRIRSWRGLSSVSLGMSAENPMSSSDADTAKDVLWEPGGATGNLAVSQCFPSLAAERLSLSPVRT